MANITISVPDAAMPRVVDAFTKQYNYQDTIPDPANIGQTLPNPETKAQFTQRMIRTHIKDTVAMYEGMAANQTAAQKARDDIG
jgi:hypothetical protein